MADTDAYQQTAPIKSAEISTNTQKVHNKSKELSSLAKAIAHLNAKIEAGEDVPELDKD